MDRSLYLVDNENIEVTADGPSLWIQKPMKAGQRVPLRLINRVYVIGNIKISSEAMLALAEQNIPLIVSRHSGEDKAIMLPYNHRLPSHFKEQRVILENAINLFKYIKWLKAYRMCLQLRLLKKYFPYLKKSNVLGEGDYEVLLAKLIPRNKCLTRVVKDVVSFLFKGLITVNLIKAGLDVHTGAYFRRVNFGFVLDLIYLLEAMVDEQVILFFKQPNYSRFVQQCKERVCLTSEGYRNIIHRFENKKSELSNQINKVIDDFFYLIRELEV